MSRLTQLVRSLTANQKATGSNCSLRSSVNFFCHTIRGLGHQAIGLVLQCSMRGLKKPHPQFLHLTKLLHYWYCMITDFIGVMICVFRCGLCEQ